MEVVQFGPENGPENRLFYVTGEYELIDSLPARKEQLLAASSAQDAALDVEVSSANNLTLSKNAIVTRNIFELQPRIVRTLVRSANNDALTINMHYLDGAQDLRVHFHLAENGVNTENHPFLHLTYMYGELAQIELMEGKSKIIICPKTNEAELSIQKVSLCKGTPKSVLLYNNDKFDITVSADLDIAPIANIREAATSESSFAYWNTGDSFLGVGCKLLDNSQPSKMFLIRRYIPTDLPADFIGPEALLSLANDIKDTTIPFPLIPQAAS